MLVRPALILAASLALAAPAAAQTGPAPGAPRIVVTGEGESTAAPDMALLSLSVMREAKTAREALDGTNQAMTAVIAAMKEAGIAPRDLQTGSVQIAPRYNYANKPDGTQTAELIGYQVSNTLNVRVRDLASTGAIIDKAVSLGVNQGGGITFTNEDPSKTLTEARKRAVADAIDRAKTLAAAAGVRLGGVLEITDQALSPPPMPMAARAFDKAEAVPIEAGENAYRVQVTVTFEMLR